jgi:CubicO group peptidase (beta-lactamase class C family)
MNKYLSIGPSILLLMMGCLSDGDLKLKPRNYQPQLMGDGWEVYDATGNQPDTALLNEIVTSVFSEKEHLFLRSLVIARGGKLVAEMYTKDELDREHPHQIWSGTKSVVALITGIAIDDGKIETVKDNIFTYLPEYKSGATPEHLHLTIEECLTMRTGIDYDNDGKPEEELLAQVPEDLTAYVLSLPMRSEPGRETIYKNSDPQLLVKVVANAVGGDFVTYADENLFKPLGISNFYWSRNRDYTPYGGFGLWLTPRDLAKVGQLLLDSGTWEGRQLVSKHWVKEATSRKTQLDEFGYGYLIWLDSENDRYWFWGHGGQYLFVLPQNNLSSLSPLISLRTEEAPPLMRRTC